MTPSARESGEAAHAGRLRVVQAARADALAVDLAAQFAAVRPGPLERCVVAVQGPGMGRWLRGFMATHTGAWGGVETPFLRGLLLGLAAPLAGDVAPRGREDLAELRFRVAAAALDALADPSHASHAALRGMVADAHGTIDHARLLAMSNTLAEAFDRAEVDRPEIVEAWARGTSARDPKWTARMVELEAWQRPIWHASARLWPTRAAWHALRTLVDSLEAGRVPDGVALPAFLSVFGVSSLPPFMVRALQAIARHVPVTLHLLSPSATFIAERVDRRRLLWAAAERGLDEATLREAQAMPAGHPLLECMGRLAAESQRVLLDAGLDLEQADAPTTPQAGDVTLLRCLQQGMLDDAPPQPTGPVANDRSVRVHAVATPRRAAEVVHDALLEAFTDMPDLLPEQVAILTPDLAGLGHTIESVFAERGTLPLTASDPSVARPSSLVVALRGALAAAMDGLPLEALLDVLGQACVQSALGLDEREAETCLRRLREAGARRFADADQRAQVLGRDGVADDRLHTVQWAVDRVVLGTALGMPVDDEASRAGAAGQADGPVDPMVLSSASAGSAGLAALHGVVACVERLAALAHALRTPRPLHAWCEEFGGVADALLPGAQHEAFGAERVRIDRAIESLVQAATAGGFMAEVDGAVARDLLLEAVADVREGTHFASGGITLARLSPMRSIPFRVLVLAGLDSGVFPRAAPSTGIDLMAALPRAGDRSPRLEDQQLFLECVHAARDRLVIVHRGIEPRTGKARPPSPALDQLLEACAAHLGKPLATVRVELSRRHVLRADQPEAWVGAVEPGFDAQARLGAQAAARGRIEPVVRPFLPPGLVPPQPPASLQAWQRMIRNPGEAFLERLGIRVPEPERALAESDELVQPDHLEAWLLKRSCIHAVLRGTSPDAWERWARLEGRLPHGERGRRIARGFIEEALRVRAAVDVAVQANGWGPSDWRTEPRDGRLVVHGMAYAVPAEVVQGTSAWVIRRGRSGRGEAYQRWIDHLMWSAAVPDGSLVLVSDAMKATIKQPFDAAHALRRLERLHDIATAGAAHPLPIHPDVLAKWNPDKQARATSVASALRSDFKGTTGLLQEAGNALAHRDETWDDEGPLVQVHPDRAPVHMSLDALAAEIVQAMTEDGWLKPAKQEGDA